MHAFDDSPDTTGIGSNLGELVHRNKSLKIDCWISCLFCALAVALSGFPVQTVRLCSSELKMSQRILCSRTFRHHGHAGPKGRSRARYLVFLMQGRQSALQKRQSALPAPRVCDWVITSTVQQPSDQSIAPQGCYSTLLCCNIMMSPHARLTRLSPRDSIFFEKWLRHWFWKTPINIHIIPLIEDRCD